MTSQPNFTPAEREYFAAHDLVTAACLEATKGGYLEPYWEMKAAAISLAKEVIRLRAATAGGAA